MNLVEAKQRPQELVEELTNLWERSVRATHLFLSEGEIQRFREHLPDLLRSVAHLFVAQEEGRPVGFMSVAEGSLEMLFLDPEARGRGLGRQLLQYGISTLGVRTLTVYEQNPQAVGFYEHMGFRVFKRTELDEQGNPYPLLYLRRADFE